MLNICSCFIGKASSTLDSWIDHELLNRLSMNRRRQDVGQEQNVGSTLKNVIAMHCCHFFNFCFHQTVSKIINFGPKLYLEYHKSYLSYKTMHLFCYDLWNLMKKQTVFFFKSHKSQPNKNKVFKPEVASKNSYLVIDLIRIPAAQTRAA